MIVFKTTIIVTTVAIIIIVAMIRIPICHYRYYYSHVSYHSYYGRCGWSYYHYVLRLRFRAVVVRAR